MVSLTLGLALWLSASDAPAGRACLVAAYPGVVCGVGDDVVLCSGARIPWDDVQDTLAMRYRPGREVVVPPVDFEPGRIRSEALLGAMYGESRDAVAHTTEAVDWMLASGGKVVRVTRVNGVADALRRVSADLERELAPDLRELAATTAGVFVWRTVRGSERRSPHSWAIAIDVGVARADYWDWNRPDRDGRYRYKNRFPMQVVEIFERHGFIWGGRWYHFDTMHFEYRPELLVAPCVDGPSPLRTLGGKDLTP